VPNTALIAFFEDFACVTVGVSAGRATAGIARDPPPDEKHISSPVRTCAKVSLESALRACSRTCGSSVRLAVLASVGPYGSHLPAD
jgi:hypothetical protein